MLFSVAAGAAPSIEWLAAARLAVEHLSHHDAPLRFLGSRYAEDTVHRFGCAAPACQFRLTITVHAP